MKKFAAATSIRARPQAVWMLLTDAASYPVWNSTVERVAGRIAPGETITVYTKAAPGRAFPVTVTKFQPMQEMTWSGGMPLGLFRGTRTFTLTPGGDDTVQFAMREEFSGLLAPLITRSIPDLQPAFDTFAADLKRRAENPV